ncbi:DUF4383 domain-containing protein [Cellulosimicrobium sp. NPDC057127]|uniref:DUF4383 domain-containing protein n=1 Tax=Cellulosimicrobium sp. NPDC057127 TaxID=3346026 RepID=UPI00362FA3E8
MTTTPQPGVRATTERPARGVHQWLALVIGVVYLIIGIVGFAITGFDGWFEHDHSQTLLGFAINPLHNVVHIVIGLLGVLMWNRSASARTYGWILAIGYGATFVYGLIVVNNEDANILNINGADNVLHAVSAIAGLAIALWPARKEHPATGTAAR